MLDVKMTKPFALSRLIFHVATRSLLVLLDYLLAQSPKNRRYYSPIPLVQIIHTEFAQTSLLLDSLITPVFEPMINRDKSHPAQFLVICPIYQVIFLNIPHTVWNVLNRNFKCLINSHQNVSNFFRLTNFINFIISCCKTERKNS